MKMKYRFILIVFCLVSSPILLCGKNEELFNPRLLFDKRSEEIYSLLNNEKLDRNTVLSIIVQKLTECQMYADDIHVPEWFGQLRECLMDTLIERSSSISIELFTFFLTSFKGCPSNIAYVQDRYVFNQKTDCSHALDFYNRHINSLNVLETDVKKQFWVSFVLSDLYLSAECYDECQNQLDKTANFVQNLDTDREVYQYMVSSFREIVFAYKGDYGNAKDLAMENLEFIKNKGTDKYSDYYNILSRLVYYDCFLGNYKEAIERTESIDFNKSLYLPSYSTIEASTLYYNGPIMRLNVYYAPVMNSVLADCYYHLGDETKSFEYIKKTLNFALNGIKMYYSTFSFTKLQNLAIWIDMISTYAPLYAYRLSKSEISGIAYDAALLYKQLFLNGERLLNKCIVQTGDAILIDKLREMEQTKLLLDNASSKIADSLALRAIQLQSQLIVDIQKYGNYAEGLNIVWQDILSCLKKDEVAIEFLVSSGVDNEKVLLADVLSLESNKPIAVPLCRISELDSITDLYTNPLAYKLVWEPLEKYIDNKTIYFAADGELNQIAVEYFFNQRTCSPINENNKIYRLSSTRELLDRKENILNLKQVVLFGGIKYNLGSDEISTINERAQSKFENNYLFVNDSTANTLRAGLSYLPGTLIEVENVQMAMDEVGYSSKLYVDNEATEHTFRNLSGTNFSVLHIATHGFYLPQGKRIKGMFGKTQLRSSMDEESLERSGLMFAGAENSVKTLFKALPSDNDGILTARELSRLDFSQVGLAVLSACETALGDIKSEGVYGLQRALKKAGVQSIIMSLWKVNDDATLILMSEFYENLGQGMTVRDALTEAQHVLRTINEGEFSSPQYWAAFILIDAID